MAKKLLHWGLKPTNGDYKALLSFIIDIFPRQPRLPSLPVIPSNTGLAARLWGVEDGKNTFSI